MFNFDILSNPKPFELYLCKPDETVICALNGIDEESASITLNLNNQYELSFDYNKYIDLDGDQIKSNGFDDLAYGMKIFVNKVGFFVMNYPPVNFDGTKEKKSITATSCDVELEYKDLVDFKINTGEKDSLEYLVEYEAGETESLLSAYTDLPYDYIVFYNTYAEQLGDLLNKYTDGTTITNSDAISEITEFCRLIPRLKSKVITANDGTMSLVEYVIYTYNEAGSAVTSIELADNFNARISALITFYTKYRAQLSLLDLAIEKCNCNWSIGEIPASLHNKKFQFSIDSSNIYAFLTQDVAKICECIVDFDLYKKEINIVPVEDIGSDSNVILDRRNLVNSFDITCDETSLCTRFNVKGGDDLSIEYVNFGSSRIVDLSYFMSARNENGDLVYVDDTLVEKYKQFMRDIEVARDRYIELTKGYNQSLEDIDEIKYRMPNDEVQNDWDTFTDTELDTALTHYNNLLVTCISLYKEEFGSAGCNNDGSVNETYMKNTVYWFDYYCYQEAIEQIEATIVARANGSSYALIDDDQILAVINAWKTEWSLFGTIELQNKIDAYNNQMNVLADSGAIIKQTTSDDAKAWSSLTDAEKTEYGGLEINYEYDLYHQYYIEREECQAYLDGLMAELATLETARDTYKANRAQLVKLVTFDGYDRDALSLLVDLEISSISPTFTAKEKKVLNLLLIDGDYSNENIITTSLDTTVTAVDIEKELLVDAQEQLSIESQPQISFSAELDNLLCMPEFADYDFTVGNYVLLEYYEGYYVRLRINQITFNPLIPTSSFTVSFTNYIKSKSKRTDLSYILGLATGSRSGGGSGSGSGSGKFGDVDLTISDTMLAKLLNSEMFGTRVSNVILDTIKVNKITAKYAKFDGLAKGTTTIDGQCIQTGVIVSNNYNGTTTTTSTGVTSYALDNTVGSILDIMNGQFNFGGGKLTWNGSSLTADGNIVATTLSTGGRNGASTGQNGLFIDSSGNLYSGSSNDVIIYNNGQFNFGNGGIVYNGSALNITANSVTIGGSAAVTASSLATELQTIASQLIGQIDGKIETWAQSTNPSSGWTSDEKAKHDGDLWLYTGTSEITLTDGTVIHPQGVYQYDATNDTWDIYSSTSNNLFDLADGKTTIWYGVYRTGTTSSYTPDSTTVSLSTGDFIYNSSQNKTYICTNSSTPTWVEFNTTNYPDLGTGDYLVDPYKGATYKWDGAKWNKMTDYKSEMALYINFESTGSYPGLMIADMTNGTATNSNVSGCNILVNNSSLNFRSATTNLVTMSANGISFNSTTPFTIGNSSSFIKWELENHTWKIKICADEIQMGGKDVMNEALAVNNNLVNVGIWDASFVTNPIGWIKETDATLSYSASTELMTISCEDSYYGIYQDITVKANTDYTISASVGSSFHIGFGDTTDNPTDIGTGWVTAPNGRVYKTFNSGSNTTCRIYIYALSDSPCIINNIKIEEGDTYTGWAPGNSSRFITYISSTDGIRVYSGIGRPNTYAQVNSNGLKIVQSGDEIASFGSSITLGNDSSGNYNMYLDSSKLLFNYGSTACGKIKPYTANNIYGVFFYDSTEQSMIILNELGSSLRFQASQNNYSYFTCDNEDVSITLKNAYTQQINITDTYGIRLSSDNGTWAHSWSSSTEARIGVKSSAGRMYLYSQNSGDYNRGLYTFNSADSGKTIIGISQNNYAYFYGDAQGNSDLRKKNIINNYDWDVDNFILSLKPIAYRWKLDGQDGKIYYGFGAQDIHKLAKNLNLGDINAYQVRCKSENDMYEKPYTGNDYDREDLIWSLSYKEFIAPMILEIQRLMKRVNELENKLITRG